ncbi:MAG: 50S ribosomal protein L29 [Candidatus Nezhaarchaeota archaeon]|nr:50S ribosomal protein L29 [Candidatus Nezhaarchaeota archaeon]MCX8141900.1 50S ribosomal protein L29 [Candidatus Nezhaarchaeota archaeon]MDW8050319.1 50S ribosomal protein L29 [Nitrososphaerota archaeon]
MAILRVNEVRKMTNEEKLAKLRELKAELMRLRAQQALGAPLDNPGKIKAIRKAIARILTIINEEKKRIKRA